MSGDERMGKTIGDRYRIERFVDAGGMGEVFEGVDTVLQRPVAIKVLRTQSEDGIRRFKREAKASSRLGSRHIVSVFDQFEDDGDHYMVMEWVGGGDLDAYIGEGLGYAQLLETATQLATGLAAIHSVGIVHRDIKPANVLVDRSGDTPILKIADFGIVSAGDGTKLTAVGAILGTPEYMSLEAVLGKEATPASDVYSLGALLYELATGRPPVSGPTPVSIIAQLVQRKQPPRAEEAGELADFIQRCLSHDVSERPSDGRAALTELRALQRTQPVSDIEVRPILVAGGVPFAAVISAVGERFEVGQTLGHDVVLCGDHPEAMFRWAQEFLRENESASLVFDYGEVDGVGVGLFAGEPVGRAFRLRRLARPGELLVAKEAKEQLGLGLVGFLEVVGTAHLKGQSHDDTIYLERATTMTHAAVVQSETGIRCPCGAAFKCDAGDHVDANGDPVRVRVVCDSCSQVLTLDPEQQTLIVEHRESQDVIRYDKASDEVLDALGSL